jgi:hypothetical protein
MGVLSDPPAYDELRENWAIQAIQQRLLNQGFDPHRTDGVFGWWTKVAVRRFQRDRILLVDGQAGERTIGELFRQRLVKLSYYYGVPIEWGVGIVIHESGFDPAATHVNVNATTDRGWTQINDTAHPEVSDEQAFSAIDNFKWTLEHLVENWTKYKKNPDIAWQCAVAAHKSPVDANEWYQTGSTDAETMKFVEDVYKMGQDYCSQLGYWEVAIPEPYTPTHDS